MGVVAIRASDLSRQNRERLLKHGFIQQVMKGWYISARPDERAGVTTAWYASFWEFCAAYLTLRFENDWCLSPEQSLSLHGGNRAVPAQLFVRTPKGGNKPTDLLHATSIFDMRLNMPDKNDLVEQDGLRVGTLRQVGELLLGLHCRVEGGPGVITGSHPEQQVDNQCH